MATVWTDRTVDFGRLACARDDQTPRVKLTFYEFFDAQSGKYVEQGGALDDSIKEGSEVGFVIRVCAQAFEKDFRVVVKFSGDVHEHGFTFKDHDPVTITIQNEPENSV